MYPWLHPVPVRVRAHGLRDPVADRGHPQHPGPAIGPGDLHRPHRRREVTPRRHPVPDLVEVVLKPLLEGRDGLPAPPRPPLVLPPLPPGRPDLVPGHRERLPVQRPPGYRPAPAVRPQLLHDAPPSTRWLTRRIKPRASRPLRSPPHRARQGDHHYYEPVRLPATATVSPLVPPALAGIPLATPTGAAVSGPALRRSMQTPQTRLAPPSRRAPPGQQSGQPPGPSRDLRCTPVPMPPRINDASNGEHPAGRAFRDRALSAQRLPGPRLTPQGRLFPDRSPRMTSANAARGGLRPPPEGRSRGATKPSSSTQHDKKTTQLRQATSSPSTHTSEKPSQ